LPRAPIGFVELGILGGPCQRLAAWAVRVLDEHNTLLHADMVGVVADESNDDAALAVLD
jgi:thiol peroxidase